MTRIPSMGEEGKTIKAGITVKNQSAWNMRYEAVILVGNKIRRKKETEADTGSDNRRKMSEHFGMSCRGIFVQYGNYVE